MARWRKTVHVKQYLTGGTSPAEVKQAAADFHAALKRLREYDADGIDEFSEIVNEFDHIARSGPDDYDWALSILEHFNSVLAALYDWADAERVWIS